mmetsp:Transcript_23022/g.66768  ORF Transcript_23022/g.66768 Transcript_23022/m.66768 type:complete len:85 (-) Transcript_23022:144-398(-)
MTGPTTPFPARCQARIGQFPQWRRRTSLAAIDSVDETYDSNAIKSSLLDIFSAGRQRSDIDTYGTGRSALMWTMITAWRDAPKA